MMGKKDGGPSTSGELNALLGRGSEFEGNLKFDGTVRIDGKFKGEINSEGTLLIGEHASVNAEIKVGVAVISGNVEGNVHAATKVELHMPAKVTGNIATPSISIQDGVAFNGQCQMAKGEMIDKTKMSLLGGKPKKD